MGWQGLCVPGNGSGSKGAWQARPGLQLLTPCTCGGWACPFGPHVAACDRECSSDRDVEKEGTVSTRRCHSPSHRTHFWPRPPLPDTGRLRPVPQTKTQLLEPTPRPALTLTSRFTGISPRSVTVRKPSKGAREVASRMQPRGTNSASAWPLTALTKT